MPLPQEPLAPELLGLTQHVAAYERLAAQAAVTGDAAIARKALLAHPLIGQHPLNEELVERLLDAEASACVRQRGDRVTRRSSSQSTAATRRPISRSSTSTARCSRSSAAR